MSSKYHTSAHSPPSAPFNQPPRSDSTMVPRSRRTSGPRSRSFLGNRDVHRSGGSSTWSSTERIRGMRLMECTKATPDQHLLPRAAARLQPYDLLYPANLEPEEVRSWLLVRARDEDCRS